MSHSPLMEGTIKALKLPERVSPVTMLNMVKNWKGRLLLADANQEFPLLEALRWDDDAITKTICEVTFPLKGDAFLDLFETLLNKTEMKNEMVNRFVQAKILFFMSCENWERCPQERLVSLTLLFLTASGPTSSPSVLSSENFRKDLLEASVLSINFIPLVRKLFEIGPISEKLWAGPSLSFKVSETLWERAFHVSESMALTIFPYCHFFKVGEHWLLRCFWNKYFILAEKLMREKHCFFQMSSAVMTSLMHISFDNYFPPALLHEKMFPLLSLEQWNQLQSLTTNIFIYVEAVERCGVKEKRYICHFYWIFKYRLKHKEQLWKEFPFQNKAIFLHLSISKDFAELLMERIMDKKYDFITPLKSKTRCNDLQ